MKGYFEWVDLQGYSKGHVTHLKSYFKKHFNNKSYSDPLKLQKYIQDKKIGLSTLVKTARSYLNYSELIGKYNKTFLESFRNILKKKEDQKDFYVPSDEDVIKNHKILKGDPVLNIIYLILLTSGIRLVECMDFLKNYDVSKFIKHNGFVSYSIASFRNTKSTNNIYLPLWVYNELITVTISYNGVRARVSKKGSIFSFKYLRKYHYNLMLFAGVPESVADFIQGRSNNSISSRHYLGKVQQATFWYKKILTHLKLDL